MVEKLGVVFIGRSIQLFQLVKIIVMKVVILLQFMILQMIKLFYILSEVRLIQVVVFQVILTGRFLAPTMECHGRSLRIYPNI